MESVWCSFGIVFLSLLASSQCQITITGSWPLVNTKNGPIIGSNFTSKWTNKTVYEFLGIPYASPPVGNYRFKDPTPVSNWTYTKNCTTNGYVCFQPDVTYPGALYVMSEDCLNLNVYSPSLSGKMPVMVYIHGGGFTSGYGGYIAYAPDMLVAEGVVVVSINYRLGALGFLSLGTKDAPGNAGFKDQVLALKWVQDNIALFGGDPTKVTVWGHSSGATSVHLHYISPLSKGLFQSAIAESGTALVNAAWSAQEATNYGLKLATILNCNKTSTLTVATALSCLQTVQVTDIIQGQSAVNVSTEKNMTGDWLVWRGTVDKDTSSKPFLPSLPETLWTQNKGSNVSILLGNVRDEGTVKLFNIVPEDEVKNITSNLAYFIPETVKKLRTSAQIVNSTQQIKNYYFPNNSTPSYSNITGYLNLLGDRMFKYYTALSARRYRTRQSNVFLYYFTYNGTFKGEDATLEQEFNISLVGHAQELNYLFVPQNLTSPLPDNSTDLLTWKRMVRMWTNFAKTGYPTSVTDQDTLLQNISWTAVSTSNLTFLNIGANLTMSSSYLKEAVDLWDAVDYVPSKSSSTSLQMTGLLLVAAVVIRGML